MRVSQLVHLAAANELLENRARFARNDGAHQRAVRKLGKLDFLHFHAQRLDHVECGSKRGLRGGLGSILEIDRHVADDDLGQLACCVLRRVIEAAPGRSGIVCVDSGDLVQHQRAIFRGSAHGPQFVQRPRKSHGSVTADQTIGRAQASQTTERGRRQNRARSLRADRERYQPRRYRRTRTARGPAAPSRAIPGIQSRTGEGRGRSAIIAAPGQLHHGELGDQNRSHLVESFDHVGVVIEHLCGVRLRAPGGRLLLHRQKIFDAVGNALERTTGPVALQLAIHVLRLTQRLLAQG